MTPRELIKEIMESKCDLDMDIEISSSRYNWGIESIDLLEECDGHVLVINILNLKE